MEERAIIKHFNKRVWVFLLLWWCCGLVLLVLYGRSDPSYKQYTDSFEYKPAKLKKNQMPAFGYTRWDPTNDYRPLYSIYFDHLNIESGQFGIFKTGAYKIAKVKGLRSKQFKYSADNKAAPGKSMKAKNFVACKNNKGTPFNALHSRMSSGRSNETCRANQKGNSHKDEPFKTLLAEMMPLIEGHSFGLPVLGSKKGEVPELTVEGIDFDDVAEVRVNDFDYQVFDNGKLTIGIQSKKTFVSYKQSKVILRGHVIITAIDGSTLESNRVKWDVEKMLFEVDGVYVLTRGGMKTSGKNIRVDGNLNIIGALQARTLKKENQKCFTKL